jgi:hypothetical protein
MSALIGLADALSPVRSAQTAAIVAGTARIARPSLIPAKEWPTRHQRPQNLHPHTSWLLAAKGVPPSTHAGFLVKRTRVN